MMPLQHCGQWFSGGTPSTGEAKYWGGNIPWITASSLPSPMQALSPPNIESELSYAYLHAVASHAGMACSVGNRHEDNNGIDATLTAWGPFTNGGYLTEVTIKVQLKATIAVPADDGASFSYFVKGVNRYDDLRAESVSNARILVVLFLPANAQEWLTHSHEQLALRRCAYWQSLRGAPTLLEKAGSGPATQYRIVR